MALISSSRNVPLVSHRNNKFLAGKQLRENLFGENGSVAVQVDSSGPSLPRLNRLVGGGAEECGGVQTCSCSYRI